MVHDKGVWSNICWHPDKIFFKEDLAYFTKTVQNHSKHILQEHGFVGAKKTSF